VNVYAPFAAVATENFFPVSVFAAVTVTPGSGVFPARTVPVISNEVAAGCAASADGSWVEGVCPTVDCEVGAELAESCAHASSPNKKANKTKTQAATCNLKTPHLKPGNFNSAAPLAFADSLRLYSHRRNQQPEQNPQRPDAPDRLLARSIPASASTAPGR